MSTSDLFQNIRAVPGMPAAEYRTINAVNASFLKEVWRCPARAQWLRDHPEGETPAMIRGTCLHSLVLEGRRDFAVYPGAVRRGEEWKAFAAANSGCTILKADEAASIEGMADALLANEEARQILVGEREQVLLWTDLTTGLPCKARIDVMGGPWCADLKSAEDASAWGFGKAAATYGHHLQAALYHDAAKAFLKAEEMRFVFAVVEPEAPHLIGLYELSPEGLELGRLRYRDALLAYAAFERHGWPKAHTSGVETLSLAPWA